MVLLLVALAASVTTPARAQDNALLQTSLFMDASGLMGVDDVAAQTFNPVANPFSRGYTAASGTSTF